MEYVELAVDFVSHIDRYLYEGISSGLENRKQKNVT